MVSQTLAPHHCSQSQILGGLPASTPNSQQDTGRPLTERAAAVDLVAEGRAALHAARRLRGQLVLARLDGLRLQHLDRRRARRGVEGVGRRDGRYTPTRCPERNEEDTIGGRPQQRVRELAPHLLPVPEALLGRAVPQRRAVVLQEPAALEMEGVCRAGGRCGHVRCGPTGLAPALQAAWRSGALCIAVALCKHALITPPPTLLASPLPTILGRSDSQLVADTPVTGRPSRAVTSRRCFSSAGSPSEGAGSCSALGGALTSALAASALSSSNASTPAMPGGHEGGGGRREES